MNEFVRRRVIHALRKRPKNVNKKQLAVDKLPAPTSATFADTLMLYYRSKILPIETALNLDIIYPVSMNDSEFRSPGTILVVGPPSVGKTTMIEYLMGCRYPRLKVGFESALDRFAILMHGKHSFTVPASAVVSDQNFPYPGLSRFGHIFVRKCYISYSSSPILKDLSIVDTPGIISQEKQKNYRGYDFDGVITFFADRADKIIFVFDVYKLDFSENVRRLLDHLQLYEDKIMIVVNKVDSVEWHELDRIQECLMWSLSRTFRRAEVTQVFFGSFWEKPLKHPEMLDVINRYQDQLLLELRQVPFTVNVRRLNDVIRRAKLARIHGVIARQLPQRLPITKGRIGKWLMNRVLRKLTKDIYPKLIIKYKIYFFDLPHPMLIKKLLLGAYRVMPQPVTKSMIRHVQRFLLKDVSTFVEVLPQDAMAKIIRTGRLDNPVIGKGEVYTLDWCAVTQDARKYHWREAFYKLNPRHGTLHVSHVKDYMQYAGLPMTVLNDIWRLVDLNKDELIDENEFCLLNWLVMYCKRGNPLPTHLPLCLKPPEPHSKPCEEVAMRRQVDIPQMVFWPRWD